MHQLKIGVWKVAIVVAGILFFLLLFIGISLSTVSARGSVGGAATPTPATVQATPTVDATMTALNKEKLAQEVNQLQHQNERSLSGLFWNNAATVLSTTAILLAALFGIFRWWFGDRRVEREKRAEERFQAIVTGLESKDIETKVGSAIMLRTFLQPGYEQFYRQVFDLAVAHLRLRNASTVRPEQPSASSLPLIVVSSKPLPQKPNLPIDSLSSALISAFKISLPFARKQANRTYTKSLMFQTFAFMPLIFLKRSYMESIFRAYYVPKLLDATGVQLDDAALFGADLAEAELAQSSLKRADLRLADLRDAHLSEADLSGVNLRNANLSNADLSDANLSGANIEAARFLKDADLRGVKGLTKEQLTACKAKGAVVDEDMTSSPPQPPVPSAQVNTPLPSTDGSRSTSSRPNVEP